MLEQNLQHPRMCLQKCRDPLPFHRALFPPHLFLVVKLSIVFTVCKAMREIHYQKLVTAGSAHGGICCEMFILADDLQNEGKMKFQNTTVKC